MAFKTIDVFWNCDTSIHWCPVGMDVTRLEGYLIVTSNCEDSPHRIWSPGLGCCHVNPCWCYNARDWALMIGPLVVLAKSP